MTRPISVSVAPSTAISAEMEIALVYPDVDTGPPGRYAVAFPLETNPLLQYNKVKIPDTSALCDVMHYPLLHPTGIGGFNQPATYSRMDRVPSIRASAASRVVRAVPVNGSQYTFTVFVGKVKPVSKFTSPLPRSSHARLGSEPILAVSARYARFPTPQPAHCFFCPHACRT